MRRKPGMQGLAAAQAARDRARALGEQVQATKLEAVRAQVATFRASLEAFAAKHRADIRADPAFRQQFHAMCAAIGVDPLVSNKGGTWARALGLGDFYYALGVAVLDVCRARRAYDGGLTDLDVVVHHVQRRRGGAADPVTADDVARAIDKLSALGGGLGVVRAGGRPYVRSVPAELSTDGDAVVALAARRGGFFAGAELTVGLGWGQARAGDALAALLRDGLLLVDDPPAAAKAKAGAGAAGGAAPAPARLYWCPAVGRECGTQELQRREGLAVTGFQGLAAREGPAAGEEGEEEEEGGGGGAEVAAVAAAAGAG